MYAVRRSGPPKQMLVGRLSTLPAGSRTAISQAPAGVITPSACAPRQTTQRFDDPPLGVQADAVRLPAEVPDALLARAVGSDARARATPVRRPDRAVARHHDPLAPLEVAADAAERCELDADHDRRCRPRAIARSTSRRSMRSRIAARLS